MSSSAPGSSPGSADCRERGLKLLALRPHFRRELATKLAARGFEPTVVEAACDRLEELGLLDDADTARQWVAVRRRRGDGPLKIRAGLSRHGVTGEIVEALLPPDFDHEVEAAAKVAERWLGRHPYDRARLGRHLQSKGWREAAILTVLERLGSEQEVRPSR